MDWEPVSREQLVLCHQYANDFAWLGASILGISVDHVLSHAAFVLDALLSFPLLADFQPRGAAARRYGIYREVQGVSARAYFLDRRAPSASVKAYLAALNPGINDLLTTLEALASEDHADHEDKPTRDR
jgi:peroxiredoxin